MPNASLTLSPEGLAFIKGHEVFSAFLYDDLRPSEEWQGGATKGTLSGGYGHTKMGAGTIDWSVGARMTEEQAAEVLQQDLAPVVEHVRRHTHVSLTQSQFDALVSFKFNTGRLAGTTLLKHVNAGDFEKAEKEFGKWIHSKGKKLRGLKVRRKAEADLWKKEVQEEEEEQRGPVALPPLSGHKSDGGSADQSDVAVMAKSRTAGASDDLELEADRAADRVVTQNSPAVVPDREAARGAVSPSSAKGPTFKVLSHKVQNATIRQPTDRATIVVDFSKAPRSFVSKLVDKSGADPDPQSLTYHPFSRRNTTITDEGRWTRNWDGMRQRVGSGSAKRAAAGIVDSTYVAPDGEYFHELWDVAYATGRTGDKKLPGKPASRSDTKIVVATRAALESIGAGSPNPHLYDASGKENGNAERLAQIISDEAKGESEELQALVAWAVRNEMIAVKTYIIDSPLFMARFARPKPKNRTGYTDAHLSIARRVLSESMSNDKVKGAIKWFSPKSGESKRSSVSTQKMYSRADPNKSCFAPSFTTLLQEVVISENHEWVFRFYK